MRSIIATIALAAIVVAIGVIGAADYAAERAGERSYCDMIRLHERTGGEAGWPDYRGIAEEICVED